VTESAQKKDEILQIEVQAEKEFIVKALIPEAKVVKVSDKIIIETPTPKKEKKEFKSKNKNKK